MYTNEQIAELRIGHKSTISSTNNNIDKYLALTDRLVDQAKEQAQFGISRRLSIMMLNINYFFTLPLKNESEISLKQRQLANVHLHSFLINLCGIIDNMAWLWALHIQLDSVENLGKIRTKIGLFHGYFNDKLPNSMLKLTTAYSDWYKFAIENRHPTAHRIPPYILPYLQIGGPGTGESRDFTLQYAHYSGQLKRLVLLHPQSIADVNTVNSLLDQLYIEIINRP